MPRELFYVLYDAANQTPRSAWIVQCDIVRDAIEILKRRLCPYHFSHLARHRLACEWDTTRPLVHGAFSAGNALEDAKAPIQVVVRIDGHEIGGRFPVLSDEHGFLFRLQLGDNLGRPTPEGGDEFSSHELPL